jgi:hypothetical protein
MSRGPGHVERKLVDLFRKIRKGQFSTRQLCLHVFPEGKTKKKHRVSVLRALKRMSRTSMPDLWRIVIKGKRDDIWLDYRSWPYPKDPPPTGAPAKNKRPRKMRTIVYRGRIYYP